YILSGQKNWISYATVADHQLVFAKTDPEARHKGISAFVVEREWPGVSTRETEHKLGVWAGSTGELFFENVEVPAENLIGEEGRRNTRETSLAKWHATEAAFRAAHLAIQVHGAYGYSAEYGLERYFRNARAPIIYEGTTQIHKLMQAEHALGYRNLNGRGGEISPLCSWAPALAAVHR